MKRSKQWAVSSNGPDAMDVETFMRAMGALHSGVVTLAFGPVGIGPNGGLLTTAEMAFAVLPGSQLPAVVGATSHWPCNQCKSFMGHLYHLLHGLDVEVQKVYEQSELWK